MIYKPAKGSALTVEQAQRYGTAIAQLIEERDGSIVAQEVVDAAEPKESPLHDAFEWNDKRAAQRWRLEQSRQLLLSIHVVVKSKDGEEEAIRAFYNVRTDDSYTQRTPGVYVTVDRMMDEEELKAQILEEAARYLRSWRKKYAQYEEFAEVVKAIDELPL